MLKVAYKTLYGAIRCSEDKTYVIKTSDLNLDNHGSTDDPLNEIQMLRKLRHRHIIRYLGHQMDEKTNQLHTFLPYVPLGDLKDWCMSQKQALSDETILMILRQLLSALVYLTEQQISHLDISLENILLVSKNPVNILLCDFGCSVPLSTTFQPETVFRLPGKPQYRAPEFLWPGAKIDTQAADVFSFGVCAFELLTHHPPFREAHARDPHFRLLQETGGLRKMVKNRTEPVYQLLEACLDVDPRRRPTFAALATKCVLFQQKNGHVPKHNRPNGSVAVV